MRHRCHSRFRLDEWKAAPHTKTKEPAGEGAFTDGRQEIDVRQNHPTNQCGWHRVSC